MRKFLDAFLFKDKSVIEEITETEEGLLIELKETIFYPGGGGQPHDTGIIKTDAYLGKVVEVYKDSGKIIHKVISKEGNIKKGDEVELHINENRRIKLVQMHTGEHVLFKSLETNIEGVKLVKIDLGEEESSLYIKAKDINWDLLFKAEQLANDIIEEDRKIIEKEYPKEEAVKLGKLRIKPERIKSETVRIVEVEEFDWSACTGTHATSTSFIGNLLITSYNVVKGNWEIRFKTNVKEDFFELARIARKTISMLETDINTVLETIEKLQNDVELYKDRFRDISYRLLDYYKEEQIGSITLKYNVVEDIEKKQLVDKATSLLEKKTFVCFMNKAEERATVLMTCSEGWKLDVPKILNEVLLKFNGKGGGRNNFAMGAVDEKHMHEIIPELKTHLINLE